jgi:hypothetical protein
MVHNEIGNEPVHLTGDPARLRAKVPAGQTREVVWIDIDPGDIGIVL